MKNPVDIYDIGCTFALLAVLGFVLLMLKGSINEGFTSDAIQCHADRPCSGHLKCINGFCADTAPKRVYEANPVPLLPGGSPYPTFFGF